ncbi:MAG: outer membrane beta-barrel protein [Bacteroidota bacterium]
MKTLAFTIALFGSTICLSQSNNDIVPSEPIKQSEFSLGLKGGFGHSFIIPYSNYTFNSSWDAGISATYSPWQHFGFGLDALYSQEGGAFIYHTNRETPKEIRTTTLNYVRVPVKVIYFFNTYEHDFRPKISVGPTVGFLMNEVNASNANFLDVGANATLGFNYRLARAVWFNADASYYQGLTDIYDTNTENDYNGNLRLDLGISLGF